MFSPCRSADRGEDDATGRDVESEVLSTIPATAGALAREFRGEFGSGGSVEAEGLAAEEPQQLRFRRHSTLGESDTETQDSRPNLNGAIEFHLSHGDSDVDSDRSEGEVEESVAGEEQILEL